MMELNNTRTLTQAMRRIAQLERRNAQLEEDNEKLRDAMDLVTDPDILRDFVWAARRYPDDFLPHVLMNVCPDLQECLDS